MDKDFIQVFKDPSTQIDIDLISFIRERCNMYPDTKIYIGTDSKYYGDNIKYATAICFRSKNLVKVIISTQRAPRNLSFYEKLYGEVYRTGEIANLLIDEFGWEFFKDRCCLHLDINPDKSHLSNKYYNSFLSIAQSYGCLVETKPDAWAASTAADHFC